MSAYRLPTEIAKTSVWMKSVKLGRRGVEGGDEVRLGAFEADDDRRLLRVAVGVDAEDAGHAVEVLRRQDGLGERGAVGGVGALERVAEEERRVVGQRGEPV